MKKLLFSCKVESKDSCVMSQTDCDCPNNMKNAIILKFAFPHTKTTYAPSLSCSTLFPTASILGSDGICRATYQYALLRESAIGFLQCPDLTCREEYGKCAVYDDYPKNDIIRCADQLCVLDKNDCPSLITCPKPGMFFYPTVQTLKYFVSLCLSVSLLKLYCALIISVWKISITVIKK